ncbi:MAG: methyltransferase domain-containing protein [Terriglobales bacterium]
MRRVVRPEVLDTNRASPEDVRDSLVDLQRINRWFGGISTTEKLITIVLERTGVKELTLLDVASASGDIAHTIQQRLARRDIRLEYTLLDRDTAHFHGNGTTRVQADALRLPFRGDSFDIVTSSLFAHHLEPEQIASFAREALRVARVALLINDLRRSYVHLAAVHAGKLLFRRITRHDSVASVWNAYTPHEMRSMLNHGAACEVQIENTYLFRMGAIAWK